MNEVIEPPNGMPFELRYALREKFKKNRDPSTGRCKVTWKEAFNEGLDVAVLLLEEPISGLSDCRLGLDSLSRLVVVTRNANVRDVSIDHWRTKFSEGDGTYNRHSCSNDRFESSFFCSFRRL